VIVHDIDEQALAQARTALQAEGSSQVQSSGTPTSG
jgi:hypothetical protein